MKAVVRVWQFICLAIFLMMVSSEHLTALESALAKNDLEKSTTIASPTIEEIKQRIQNIEATSLSDESKQTLLEIYQQSITNIEKETLYHQERKTFDKTMQTATKSLERLTHKLNSLDTPKTEINATLKGMTLAMLTKEERKAKVELLEKEEKLSTLNKRLSQQRQRPPLAKKRLILLKKELDERSSTFSNTSTDDATQQAKIWVTQTEIRFIKSEIKMLNKELLTHQDRIKILQLKRDISEKEFQNFTKKVQNIGKLLNLRRVAEVKSVQEEVEITQEASKDKHPLVHKLAQRNVALAEKLKNDTLALKNLPTQESHYRETTKRIEEDLSLITQKLQFSKINQELGEVLVKQQNRLPKLSMIERKIEELKVLFAKSSLEQIHYREESKNLRDIEEYLNHFTQGISKEEQEAIYNALKSLAQSRQALLTQAIEIKSSYSQALEELANELRKLLSVVESYRAFLAKNLFWIRSTKPVNLTLFTHLSTELEELFSLSNWMDTGSKLIERFSLNTSAKLMLALLLLLILLRNIFLRKAFETNRALKSIRTDHFLHTLKALFWTALASLSLPLVMLFLGWQLSMLLAPTPFSHALSLALLKSALLFIYLLFLSDLARDEGVIVKHFRWSEQVAQTLHKQLKILMLTIVPFSFMMVYSLSLESVGIAGGLTFITLFALLFCLGFFLVATFTPKGGVLRGYYEQNSQLFLVRYHFLLEKIAILFFVMMGVLILLGYIHTATILIENLLLSIWVLYSLVIVRGLFVRWILLVNRRLEIQAILARRQESKIAKEEIDSNETTLESEESDELEVDFVEISTQTRKLLDMTLFSTAIVALWFIWSELLPAFGFLNEVSLWSSVGIVDGVDKIIPVTLGDFILAITAIIITVIASRGLPALVEFILLQSENSTLGGRYTTTTLLRYVIIAIGVFSFFNIIGANWSQLQWLAAALSVGIGFGLQEIVANFISGIIILFERPIRVGDTVTVAETTGIVSRIQIRATMITTWDRQELLVPNKEFITTQLLNWTLSDQTVRIVIPVGIAYESDVSKAMRLLKEVAINHDGVLEVPKSFVAFESFGDNALQLSLRAYVRIDRLLELSTALRVKINQTFNQEGVTMAFPQRDIHFDSDKPLDIRIHQTKTSHN